MDLKSRKVLWSKREKHSIDSRAVTLAGDRIVVFSHDRFLAAVDTKTGNDLWRTDSAAVLDAVGEHDPADNPRLAACPDTHSDLVFVGEMSYYEFS